MNKQWQNQWSGLQTLPQWVDNSGQAPAFPQDQGDPTLHCQKVPITGIKNSLKCSPWEKVLNWANSQEWS